MHGLFEWCAERWPGRTALHHRGRAITYRELAETADAYAAELQARGVERGSIVPVLLPRSPNCSRRCSRCSSAAPLTPRSTCGGPRTGSAS